MGNIGMPELIFIMVIALLIFGPKKLPELGKQLGKGLGEFKRASNDLKRTIDDEIEKAGRDEPPPVKPAEGVVSQASQVAQSPQGVQPVPFGRPDTGPAAPAFSAAPAVPATSEGAVPVERAGGPARPA